MDRFSTSITDGNISAISLPTPSETSVGSVFAAWNVLFRALPDEGPDHPDAGYLLPQDPG